MKSLAEFMDTDESDAFIVRIIRFFYLEAMKAGQAYHQSTGALLDRPPGSREKCDSVCAAMVAGAFRTTFEEIFYEGMSSLSDNRKDHGESKPDQPFGISVTAATATVTPDAAEPILNSEHAPAMQTEQLT